MATDVHLNLLDHVEIPEPCPMSWREMQGDSLMRFCPECRKNVYNLSAMTSAEAEKTLHEHEGHLCAQIRRRLDGTIITRWSPRSNRWPGWLTTIAASSAAFFTIFMQGCIPMAGSVAPRGGKVCRPETDNDAPPPSTSNSANPANEQNKTSPSEPSPNTTGQSTSNPPFLWDGAETFGSKSNAYE